MADAAWVGLAGTALGIGGTLLTQWLSGHREREREQAAWKREDERQWLVDRREAYATLFAAVQEWQDVVRDGTSSIRDGGDVTDGFGDRIVASERRFDEASGLVVLLATKPVRKAMAAVSRRLVVFATNLVYGKPYTEGELREEERAIHAAIVDLTAAMRADLGVERVEAGSTGSLGQASETG